MNWSVIKNFLLCFSLVSGYFLVLALFVKEWAAWGKRRKIGPHAVTLFLVLGATTAGWIFRAKLFELLLQLPIVMKMLVVLAAFALYGAAICWRHPSSLRLSFFVSWSPVIVLLALVAWRTGIAVAVLGTFWLLWLAAQLGQLVWPRGLGVPHHPCLVSLGLAFMMTGSWFLGQLGVLVAPAVLAITGALTVVFWRGLIRTAERLWKLGRRKASASAFSGAYQGVVFALAFVGLGAASGPEVGADGLQIRVAGTARFLDQGSLTPFEDNVWSFGTVGAEALQAWLFPFAGTRVSRLLALGVVLVLASSRPAWGGAGAGYLPLLLSSLVYWHFSSGHADLLQSLFWISAFWVVIFARKKASGWFLAGLLSGAATAVKLNGLGCMITCGLAVLFSQKSPSRVFRAIALFGFGVVSTLGPWLLRTYLLTGNPVFPFAAALFPHSLQNPPVVHHYGIGLRWPDTLTVPVQMFTHPERFVEVGSYNILFAFILLLAHVGLFLPPVRILGWNSLLCWVFWLITEQNLRYSLPAAWSTSLLCVYVLRVAGKGRLFRVLSWVILVGAMASMVVDLVLPTGWFIRGPSGAMLPQELVIGQESKQEYLGRMVPSSVLGAMVRTSGNPFPQVCEVGLSDHLYVPGRQPALFHSLEPLATRVYRLLASEDQDGALREAHRLDCDWLIVNMAPRLRDPLEKRAGVFSESFWQRFGELEAAVRQQVLLRSNRRRHGPSLWVWQSSFVPTISWDISNRRAACGPFFVEGRTFVRCRWRTTVPTVGHVDLAARSPEGRLILFYRQDFTSAPGFHSLLVQTLPPTTGSWSLVFSGVWPGLHVECQTALPSDVTAAH